MKNLKLFLAFFSLFLCWANVHAQLGAAERIITNPTSYWQLSMRAGYDFPTYKEDFTYIDYKGGLMGGLSVNRYWNHWGFQTDFDYIRNAPKVVGLDSPLRYVQISSQPPYGKAYSLTVNVTEKAITRTFFGLGPAYKYQTKNNKFSFELAVLGGLGIINGGETLAEGSDTTLPSSPIPLTYHSGFDNEKVFTLKSQFRANYFFNEHWGLNIGSYYMNHFGVFESKKNNLLVDKGYINAGDPSVYLYEIGKGDYIVGGGTGPSLEEGNGFTSDAEPRVRASEGTKLGREKVNISSIGLFAGVTYKFTQREKPKVPAEKVVEAPVEKPEVKVEKYCVQVKAKDKFSGEILPNTDVALKNKAGDIIGTSKTDAFGVTKFCDILPEDYTIEGVYEEIKLDAANLNKSEFVGGALINKEVIYSNKEFIVKGNAVECNTTKPIPGISIVLENNAKGVNKTSLTDEKGNFLMRLPEEGVYVLYGKKDGYFSQKEEVNASNFDRSKTLFVQLEICAEKADCGKAIGLKNILFDLAKYDIKEEAKPELNKLVQFMKDNPDVKVEVGSHTDCRASTAYNQKLSQQRANASVAYIVSQGISIDRISGKGYGESVLLNECADGVSCSEEQHAINRRTEFKVICPQ